MSEQPWFKDGLRFQCSQCGDCCTGAPGFVWVNQEEIEKLARKMGLEPEAFERLYVRQVGNRKSLVELPNGDCALFDSEARKCTVYEARPRQCRSWPFWKSNVATPADWDETCRVCPGSGQGALIPLEQIIEQVRLIRI